MSGRHRWTLGIATGTSLLGFTVTSGLILLANHFVDEFSKPHKVLDEDQYSWQMPAAPAEPPRTQRRPLTFQTSDGKLLCGDFWAQPRPAPTVIICHGYRVTRKHLRPAAALEYACGYNVLLFDFRGHGESDSVITSGGNAEVRDLEAAIVAASMQPETLPHTIILHGFSMGAAIALITPPHPDVVAIIADSPFARSDEILRRLVHYYLMLGSSSWTRPLDQLRTVFPAVAWATVVASIVVYRLRFGYSFVARPDTSFKRMAAHSKQEIPRPIPILLIHAAGDEMIPIAHARQLAAEAQAYNVPLETYFVEDAGHCGAYGRDPEQYTAVIYHFLSKHLKDSFPQR